MSYLLTHRARADEGPSCVEVVGAHRSGSRDAAAVIERWRGEARKIIQRAADREGLVIAEDIYAKPGKSALHTLSLKVHGLNRLDEKRKREARMRQVDAEVQEVLEQPAGGKTDLLHWFHMHKRSLDLSLPSRPREERPERRGAAGPAARAPRRETAASVPGDECRSKG